MLDKEKSGLSDHDFTPIKKHICLIRIANEMKFVIKERRKLPTLAEIYI